MSRPRVTAGMFGGGCERHIGGKIPGAAGCWSGDPTLRTGSRALQSKGNTTATSCRRLELPVAILLGRSSGAQDAGAGSKKGAAGGQDREAVVFLFISPITMATPATGSVF